MFYRFRRKLLQHIPKFNIELIYKYSFNTIEVICPKIEVECQKLSIKDLDKLDNVKKLNKKVLNQRIERGDECYVCLFYGKVISYHWVQYNGEHLLQQAGQIYNLQNEACIYHVRVKEDFQKNKISSFVYCKIVDNCLRNNIDNIWIYTNYNNIANQKSLEKIGFRQTEKIYSFKIENKYYKYYNKKI